MKAAVVILSMFAVALCAPLGEQSEILDVDGEDIRIKRAKEQVMFGNQQNEQQNTAKRADPLESIDENGYIVAKEPVELETEEAEEPTSADVENESTEDITDGESNIVDTGIEEQEGEETETMPEDNVEIPETEESEDTTAVVPVEDNEMSVEDYLKEFEKLQADSDNISPYFNNLLRERDPYGDQYRYYNPYSNYQRYRRSQVRAFNNYQFPRARVLKRAHRTKRQAYYVPDVQGYGPYDEDLLESPYNNYPVTEEDLADLLDVLDDARVYDDNTYTNPYEEYAPYDDLGGLEFESPIFVPKRQAGLTFVPGIKRNRDFYPYFTEPDTHYKAFVSQDKRSMRDYADAYERVMELAAALRQQNYYPDEYLEGYRRRK